MVLVFEFKWMKEDMKGIGKTILKMDQELKLKMMVLSMKENTGKT